MGRGARPAAHHGGEQQRGHLPQPAICVAADGLAALPTGRAAADDAAVVGRARRHQVRAGVLRVAMVAGRGDRPERGLPYGALAPDPPCARSPTRRPRS